MIQQQNIEEHKMNKRSDWEEMQRQKDEMLFIRERGRWPGGGEVKGQC